MDHLPAEIKERVARLNTQLRFGRIRPALTEAYKLRTYLQLKGAQREGEAMELARVERIINTLEAYHTTGIQKLVRAIIDIASASLNPEVDNTESLLDKFSPPKKVAEASPQEAENLVGETVNKGGSEEEGTLFPEEPDEAAGDSETAKPPAPAKPAAKPKGSQDEEEVDWGWGPLS